MAYKSTERPGRHGAIGRLSPATGRWLAVLLALPLQLAAQTPAPPPPGAATPDSVRRVTLSRSLAVPVGGQLRLLLQTPAQVIFSGVPGREVTVGMDLSGPYLEAGVRTEGPDAVVFSRTARPGTSRAAGGGTLRIGLPRGTAVSATLWAGGVAITDVDARITLGTQAGDITATNLSGTVMLHTRQGAVRLAGGLVSGSVAAGPGGLSLDKVRGRFSASTPGGDFTVNSPGQPVSASIGGSGGTGGGGLLTLAVREGDVDARTYGMPMEVEWKGGKGARNLRLNLLAQKGDITLRLPNGISLDVNVEEIQETTGTPPPASSSEFGGFSPVRQATFTRNGKQHRLTARRQKTGDGSNRVELKTIDGRVTLKKG